MHFLEQKVSRRDVLRISGVSLAGIAVVGCAPATPEPAPALPPEPPVANADEALQRLVDGNARYVGNRTVDPNQTEARRIELAAGQKPFATIFSCVDSRVPPELVFDRGLGDLFVIRTAGHVVDSAVLGSIEFGSAELGVPLIVVLGHEKCGAVKATIEAVEANATAPGSIGALVAGIKPAVTASHGKPGDALDNAILANVEGTVNRLRQSPVLSKLVADGKVKIVGGWYDLDSGAVEITVR